MQDSNLHDGAEEIISRSTITGHQEMFSVEGKSFGQCSHDSIYNSIRSIEHQEIFSFEKNVLDPSSHDSIDNLTFNSQQNAILHVVQRPEFTDEPTIEFYSESGQRLTATIVLAIPENIEGNTLVDNSIFVSQDQTNTVLEKSVLLENLFRSSSPVETIRSHDAIVISNNEKLSPCQNSHDEPPDCFKNISHSENTVQDTSSISTLISSNVCNDSEDSILNLSMLAEPKLDFTMDRYTDKTISSTENSTDATIDKEMASNKSLLLEGSNNVVNKEPRLVQVEESTNSILNERVQSLYMAEETDKSEDSNEGCVEKSKSINDTTKDLDMSPNLKSAFPVPKLSIEKKKKIKKN